jgi:hypothetical protein
MRHGLWGFHKTGLNVKKTTPLRFVPAGEIRPGSPAMVVNEGPNDGGSLDDILHSVEAVYTARDMRMESHRRGTQDGHSWLEVRLVPSRAAGDVRMLGYVLVTGNRFAWVVCGGSVSHWDELRQGCEATLATVHIGARAPAAAAGRRRIGEGDISLAVPAAWQERRSENNGQWQIMSSERGVDTDVMQVVVTGGSLGVPRAQVLDRLTENLQHEGYTPSNRARRTVPAGTVDTIVLNSHEDVPDIVIYQRLMIVSNFLYGLTCAGPSAQFGGSSSPCIAMFDGFRLTR